MCSEQGCLPSGNSAPQFPHLSSCQVGSVTPHVHSQVTSRQVQPVLRKTRTGLLAADHTAHQLQGRGSMCWGGPRGGGGHGSQLSQVPAPPRALASSWAQGWATILGTDRTEGSGWSCMSLDHAGSLPLQSGVTPTQTLPLFTQTPPPFSAESHCAVWPGLPLDQGGGNGKTRRVCREGMLGVWG